MSVATGWNGTPGTAIRADTSITLVLEEEAIEHEEIIVSSTRTERRIEDEPIRVEVVVREEIEERALLRWAERSDAAVADDGQRAKDPELHGSLQSGARCRAASSCAAACPVPWRGSSSLTPCRSRAPAVP